MNLHIFALCAMLCAQAPGSSPPDGGTVATVPAPPPPPASAPVPVAPATSIPDDASGSSRSLESVIGPIDPDPVAPIDGLPASPGPNPYAAAGGVPGMPGELGQPTRGLFESDHAFDGFSTPLSNPVQSKDPRSLTEVRFLYIGDYSRKSTPVIGGGTFQVYAMQVRLAVTDRLQLYADKDGLVMVSPKDARSIFGIANIMAGAKYVFIRDEENQFLFSGALQYEAPTGYPAIFEGHGNGLLGVYGIVGKQFFDNWHFISTFGQNIALNQSNSGYFMTTAHLDRRFGKWVPFYEANWFYYNQSGNHLPGVGIEGGGLLNLGASKVMGLNYVTNAVGFNYEFNQHVIFGIAYEFQLTSRAMLMNNMLNMQLIFRY